MSCSSDYSDDYSCSDSGCSDESSTCTPSESGSCVSVPARRYRRSAAEVYPPGRYSQLPVGAIPFPTQTVTVQQPTRRREQFNMWIPINPISQLVGSHFKRRNEVHVSIRRSGGIMSLQWEGFSGQIGGGGFRHVAANFSFSGLPISAVEQVIKVEYRGISHLGYVRIDAHAADVIQFHFSLNGDIVSSPGDRIVVPGSTVQWNAAC